MPEFSHQSTTWPVDSLGFLLDPLAWDEPFAEGMAERAGIRGGLTEEHWRIIRFIRDHFDTTGRCPLVYQTCRACRLKLDDVERLFPAGYLRGACLLAGISYRTSNALAWAPSAASAESREAVEEKTYRVDVHGFLVNPSEWDEQYALHKALEMGMWEGLSERHLEVLRFLREFYEREGRVPTVYETCRRARIMFEELEELFPTGYQRGAVKLAGLQVR